MSDALMVADHYGSGATVMLLHGQPGTAWDWQWVIPLLEPEFSVLVPDRPGYGRTGGAATGFAGNAQAVIDLLDHNGISEAILVGHSWAGGIVLAAAERFPDRVTGAVLVSSVGPGERIRWDDRMLAAPVIGDILAAILIGGSTLVIGNERVQRAAAARLEGKRALQAFKAVARLTKDRPSREVRRSFMVEQRALVDEIGDLTPGLGGLTIPVVIINGTNDHLVPPKVGSNLANTIRAARQVLLANVGHLLPHDRPQEIADAVRSLQPGRS